MPDTARRYTQVAKAIYERPWAIQPSMLAVLAEVVQLRVTGAPLSDEEIEARVAAARNGPRSGPVRAQGVAVLPIYGVISPRMDLMTAMSGGTSVEGVRRMFREAQADPDIGAIVFDIDSPGGAVDGIFELADEIRAARGGKPMAAVGNALIASAAYAIASAADEIVASPSSQVGSIGVVAMRPDQSASDEQEGMTYNVITAGKSKDTWNPHVALSDEGRDEIQSIVDDYYDLFVGAVTKSRGVTAKIVTDEWQAKMFTAQKAVKAGLADRVDTLDGTIRRMVVQANRSGPAAVHALAAAGLTAQEQVGVLMSTLPIHEQLALLNAEGERVSAHYAKRAELRAKEGRSVPEGTEEQLAALTSLGTIQSESDDPDLDTDQPEEADPPKASGDWRGRARLDVLEAATAGGYQLPPIEVPTT
jgi:signal peptide peptidase SppA